MRVKAAAACVLLALIPGCEPDPIKNPTGQQKTAPAEKSLDDEFVDESPAMKTIRQNAEALCALAERERKRSTWFSCERDSTESANMQPACQLEQVEAGHAWLEDLQNEAIQEIGQDATLGCFQEGTNAGEPALGRRPSPQAWLTDYVLVNECVRDRIERARAEATR